MLIIESRKAIFIHAEKCAGSSIEAALDPLLEIYDIRVGGTKFGEDIQQPFRKRFGIHKHSKAREIRRVLTPEKYREYFVFFFVRHPLARVISAYRYLGSTGWDSEVTRRVRQMGSIKEFIESPDLSWLTPAHAYIFDRQGNNLVDFVGRVESMEKDFAYVCGRLGYDNIEQGKTNISKSGDSILELEQQILVDQDCVAIINENFNMDFETFQYQNLTITA